AAPRVVTGFDVGDLVSHFGELAGDVLGGSALALEGLGVAGVRGVDPDQIAGQGGDLFLGQPQSVVLISARYCLGVLAHLAFLSSARTIGGRLKPAFDHGVAYRHNTAGLPPARRGGLEASEWRNGRRASLRC